MNRRHACAALASLCLAAGPAFAQGGKTTRIVVAFPPGGPVDFVARTIADQLGRELQHTIIVENKAGANGAIAAEFVARAAPDGTTVWLTSVGAVAINPSLYAKLSYDAVRDFEPVSLVVNNVEALVVHPSNPAQGAAAFVAASKQGAQRGTLASSGIGSIPHLAIEQLNASTGAGFVHVPYKGAAPAIQDVMGGQVGGFFGDVPGLMGGIKGGRLRAIGIAAQKRHPVLPDVPTLAEQGIANVDTNNWYALFAPAKTPPEAIAELNRAVKAVLATPAVRDRLLESGAEPASSTPAELAALLKADTLKWGALIRERAIKAE